jgi:hypothetical protein
MIALAWLHGCEFFDANEYGWFVNDVPAPSHHPMEAERFKNRTGNVRWGWDDRESLARDYCEWHGLLSEAT